MAQFRGTIEGQRGVASRLGSKSSGLRVIANGWNTGVTVLLDHENGRDTVTVYRTGGSGGRGKSELIGQWDDAPAPAQLPLCVLAMGCLCAGHARGNPADEPCDTREGVQS
jgi:hypothetical protein